MRICVLGVGLVGGSVALAARRRLGAHVSGWDPDPRACERALLRGVLDTALEEPAQGAGADAWIVAAPVGALEAAVRTALAHAGPDAVVTDVGSVKHQLVAAVDDERFVGGHPLAGAEAAGVEHAREDLFDGATWYLTPGPRTSGVKYERLHRFLTNVGARPQAIDADAHDRLMAAVSHLPHVLANLLVEQACAASGGGDVAAPVGPSFRDATRVAGANPPLWAQIYAANAPALGAQLDAVIARLQDLRGRLGDLEDWQEEVRAAREGLLAAAGGAAGAGVELRVSVPNRPGVVADLALTLGRAGINIDDMALAPSPDGAAGLVGLWVAPADLDRARELIAQKGFSVS